MRRMQIRGRNGAAALRLSPVAGMKRYMTSSVAPRQHPPTADGDGDAAAARGMRARAHSLTHHIISMSIIIKLVIRTFQSQAATGVTCL